MTKESVSITEGPNGTLVLILIAEIRGRHTAGPISGHAQKLLMDAEKWLDSQES